MHQVPLVPCWTEFLGKWSPLQKSPSLPLYVVGFCLFSLLAKTNEFLTKRGFLKVCSFCKQSQKVQPGSKKRITFYYISSSKQGEVFVVFCFTWSKGVHLLNKERTFLGSLSIHTDIGRGKHVPEHVWFKVSILTVFTLKAEIACSKG